MQVDYTLPSSILIVGAVKIPDMISTRKCGFGGGASTAKLKKEIRPDDSGP
jgi:hypothetical protein